LLNLVQNENMKIYRRIRTWILVLILIALTATVSLIMKNSQNNSVQEDWRVQTERSLQVQKENLKNDAGMPKSLKEKIERDIKVAEYRLQNDIAPTSGMWSNVLTMANMIQLVTIFTVVIAADIVAGEFAGGTIKLLLIRPASRSKILLSKYISTILFSLFLLATLFVSAFVLGGILYGFSGATAAHLFADSNLVIHESSMLLHALNTYGLKCVELIMIVTLAFMISTVFRSSSFAIGMSLMTMFLGAGVSMFLMRYDWGKYWLFMNTDLTMYLEGQPMMKGMTMGFSIAVLVVYFLIFNVLSWTIFNKRDVAA